MPRTYKRKTERANTAPDTVLRAVRAVRIENRSIRSVARDFGGRRMVYKVHEKA